MDFSWNVTTNRIFLSENHWKAIKTYKANIPCRYKFLLCYWNKHDSLFEFKSRVIGILAPSSFDPTFMNSDWNLWSLWRETLMEHWKNSEQGWKRSFLCSDFWMKKTPHFFYSSATLFHIISVLKSTTGLLFATKDTVEKHSE